MRLRTVFIVATIVGIIGGALSSILLDQVKFTIVTPPEDTSAVFSQPIVLPAEVTPGSSKPITFPTSATNAYAFEQPYHGRDSGVVDVNVRSRLMYGYGEEFLLGDNGSVRASYPRGSGPQLRSMAERLLRINGVTRVYCQPYSIRVEKAGMYSWTEEIVPQIAKILEETLPMKLPPPSTQPADEREKISSTNPSGNSFRSFRPFKPFR